MATALGEYCPNGDDITTEAECAAAAAALGLTFVAAFDGPGDHQNCLNAPQHVAPGVYFNTAAVPGDPIPTYSSLCSAVPDPGKEAESKGAAMRFARPVSDDGLRGSGGRVGGLEGIEIDTPQNTKAMLRGLPAEEGAVASHESASVMPADSSHDDLDLAIEAQARKELKLGLGAVR